MAERHDAECDQCGKREALRRVLHGEWDFPAGWQTVVSLSPPKGTALLDQLHLCSWRCVALYAKERAVTG